MGKFNPGGNRQRAVINGDFLRPTGARSLIPSLRRIGGHVMSVDHILIARILFTLVTAGLPFLR